MFRASGGRRTATRKLFLAVILAVSAITSLAGSGKTHADVHSDLAARLRAVLRTNSLSSTALTPLQPSVAPQPLAGFGSSVALGFGTAVVGSPGEDSKAGAAYIFVEDAAGNWTQQARLVAVDGGSAFGSSVAIAGHTVLVGMQGPAGAMVFTRQGSTWSSGTRLDIPGPGSAVALAPSGRRAVVGTAGFSSTPDSVYVFARGANGQWTREAVLTGEAGQAPPTYFGNSVAISGNTIVVGAYGEESFGGAVYVFTRDSHGVWRQQTRITGPATSFLFGWSVDTADRRMVIGAYGESDFRGGAYIFEPNAAGVWTKQARLAAPTPTDVDTCFGLSVALTFDGALVGQSCDGERGGDPTRLFVFAKDATGAWIQRAALVSPAKRDTPDFAEAVATNGFSALIGSPSENHTGAAYTLNCLPCLALPHSAE